MTWSQGMTYFFGGLFFANFTPHFIAGVSGRSFHTPFAKPPFRGVSSPQVNLVWGFFNLAVAYWLLIAVGELELRHGAQVAVAAAGFAAGALFVARSVTKMRREAAEASNRAE